MAPFLRLDPVHDVASILSRLRWAEDGPSVQDALVDAALLVESSPEAARSPDLRAALHALAAHPDPKIVAAAIFAVGKLPGSAELVTLCRSTLARHLPKAGADDAAVVYQCLIALENLGESIPWRGGSITAAAANRRTARRYLSR